MQIIIKQFWKIKSDSFFKAFRRSLKRYSLSGKINLSRIGNGFRSKPADISRFP